MNSYRFTLHLFQYTATFRCTKQPVNYNVPQTAYVTQPNPFSRSPWRPSYRSAISYNVSTRVVAFRIFQMFTCQFPFFFVRETPTPAYGYTRHRSRLQRALFSVGSEAVKRSSWASFCLSSVLPTQATERRRWALLLNRSPHLVRPDWPRAH